jgi:hypothetical protein
VLTRPAAVELKIAYPLRTPEDDNWERLHRIAASGEAGARKRFLEAVKNLRENIDVDAVADALTRGDVDAILRMVRFDDLTDALHELEQSLDEIRSKGFRLGRTIAEPHLHPEQLGIHLGARSQLAIAFNHLSQHVLDQIRTAAAERVTGITDATKLALRQILERKYTDGAHPRQMVPAIRETIGLRPSQEASVERYRVALAEDATVPPKRADQLVSRMRKRMLTERATTIARHESILAANEGQRASWQTLLERGLLFDSGGGGMEREWMAIVPTDGRTCIVCESLDGARAPIEGSYGSLGDNGPPQHVACRCTERLVPIKVSE